MRSLLLALTAALTLAACGSQGLDITDARIGEPTGPNAALYFTAEGADDRLLSARTDIAPTVQLHQTQVDSDGTMAMVPVTEMVVTSDEALVLEPGGLHLMLVDVDHSISTDDKVEVVLVWSEAGEVVIEAEVVDPGDTPRADG